MKERLQLLIQSEELTSSRFAEMLGIQPSNVSHLLSGRNNPGYDLIVSILTNFPNVSPDWLLMGVGDMYRDSKHGKPHEPSLFDDVAQPELLAHQPTVHTTDNNTTEPQAEAVVVLYSNGVAKSYSIK